jgi:outer membrane lipoprotein-sorting protein
LAVSAFTIAQDAKKVLDQLSEKASNYSSMKADFEYTMVNKTDGIDESQKGSIMTKGDKYHLEIAGQRIISDGETVWTVIEEAEEVQINNVPKDEEADDFISPTKILTLWEKGFNYKYDKESTLNGNKVDIINLYPEEAEEKSYHTIKLYVDKAKMEIAQIVIKGKDGTDFTYKISSFQANKEIPASSFTFSNGSFEVIDLR